MRPGDIDGGDAGPGAGQGEGDQVVPAAEDTDGTAGHVAEILKLLVIKYQAYILRYATPVYVGVDVRLPSGRDGVPAFPVRFVQGIF